MASQKPARPDALHVSQVPPQRPSQQNPSVQKPLAHSLSPAHAAPCGRTHSPLVQTVPGMQSALPVHDERQSPVPALHTKGSQVCVPALLQVPAPSQVEASVEVLPLQDAATQVVPPA